MCVYSSCTGRAPPCGSPGATSRVREGAAAACEGAAGASRYPPLLLMAAGQTATCCLRPRRGHICRAPAGEQREAFPRWEGCSPRGTDGSHVVTCWIPRDGFRGLYTFSLTLGRRKVGSLSSEMTTLANTQHETNVHLSDHLVIAGDQGDTTEDPPLSPTHRPATQRTNSD